MPPRSSSAKVAAKKPDEVIPDVADTSQNNIPTSNNAPRSHQNANNQASASTPAASDSGVHTTDAAPEGSTVTAEEEVDGVIASPTPVENLLAALVKETYHLGQSKRDFFIGIRWFHDGKSYIAVPNGSVAGGSIEPIEFFIAGRIEGTGYYLLPDGGWRENSRYQSEFDKAEASFSLSPAEIFPEEEKLWTNCIENVKRIRMSATGLQNVQGILSSSGATFIPTTLKFGWELFEPKQSDSVEVPEGGSAETEEEDTLGKRHLFLSECLLTVFRSLL
ncbi:hypothetical protein FRC03_005803 [Tulasnella sp. 419]|nr:hypothetical protein FRC03_005803 [Tulasnella sp. 419]